MNGILQFVYGSAADLAPYRPRLPLGVLTDHQVPAGPAAAGAEAPGQRRS